MEDIVNFINKPLKKTDEEEAEKALVNAGYIKFKISRAGGYISRKTAGMIVPYNGKYGVGYRWLYPAFDSTRYYFVAYYIK